MGQHYKDNILESDAQAIVNPVNTKGVMGAGLAKQFKAAYPKMFESYKGACKDEQLQIGQVHTYEENGKRIINLPTKEHWKDPSEMYYIEKGLDALVKYAKEEKLESLDVPPLGTGLGGLKESDVYPVMDKKLQQIANTGTRVVFYDSQGARELTNQMPPDRHCDPRLEQLQELSDTQLEQFHQATRAYLDVRDAYNTPQLDSDVVLDHALSGQVLEKRRGERDDIDKQAAVNEASDKAHSVMHMKNYKHNVFPELKTEQERINAQTQFNGDANISNVDREPYQLNSALLELAKDEKLPLLSVENADKLYDNWIEESPKLKSMMVRVHTPNGAWVSSGVDELAEEYDTSREVWAKRTPENKQRAIQALWMEKSIQELGEWDNVEYVANLRNNENDRLEDIVRTYSDNLVQYHEQLDFKSFDKAIEKPVVDKSEPTVISENSHHIMTTGHRPDKMVGKNKGWGYLETTEAKQMEEDMAYFIHDRMEQYGHVTVHSGMSQGADTVFANAALRVRNENPGKVALHCDIPFEGQESKWTKKVQERYQTIRNQADSETVYGSSYANKWYAARNRGMVDASNECTAVYNGIDTSGGTRMTVDMIVENEKPVTYFGGYMLRDKTISLEVAENTYAPTDASREHMRQLRVESVKPLVEQVTEKNQAALLYKNLQQQHGSSARKTNPQLDVGGIEL